MVSNTTLERIVYASISGERKRNVFQKIKPWKKNFPYWALTLSNAVATSVPASEQMQEPNSQGKVS